MGQSTNNAGVYGGSIDNYGVWGISTNGTGVIGQSTSGFGVHSVGPAYVQGDLTVTGGLSYGAKTSYINISAAAFHPSGNGYAYTNIGSYLSPSDSVSSLYEASVQLPHGAEIVSLTYYWYDSDVSNDTWVELIQSDLYGSGTPFIVASSTGSSGADSTTESCSSSCVVDNQLYAYFVQASLPAIATQLHAVQIEYVITGPY